MKRVAMILIVILIPAIAAADDTPYAAMLLSFAVIDYHQSVNMFFESGEFEELNPLLGARPSRSGLLAFGAVGLGLTWLLADLLPSPWSRVLMDSVIASERFNIEENRRAYLGWNTEGPPLRGREIEGIPLIVSIRF